MAQAPDRLVDVDEPIDFDAMMEDFVARGERSLAATLTAAEADRLLITDSARVPRERTGLETLRSQILRSGSPTGRLLVPAPAAQAMPPLTLTMPLSDMSRDDLRLFLHGSGAAPQEERTVVTKDTTLRIDFNRRRIKVKK